MDESLRFEYAIIFLSNCDFLRFSALSQRVFITDFFPFLFLIMHLQLSIPHSVVNKILTP